MYKKIKRISMIFKIIGVAGTIGSLVLTAIKTKEAVEEGEFDILHDKPTKDEILALAKRYAIPAACTVGSIASFLSGIHYVKGEYRKLLRLYLTAAQSFAAVDAAERLKAAHEENEEQIKLAPAEEEWFYDFYSKRYFRSTKKQIYKAMYEFNRNFTALESSSVNDFYQLLNNPDMTPLKNGDDIGWEVYQLYSFYGYTWVEIEVPEEPDMNFEGIPCTTIMFAYPPTPIK